MALFRDFAAVVATIALGRNLMTKDQFDQVMAQIDREGGRGIDEATYGVWYTNRLIHGDKSVPPEILATLIRVETLVTQTVRAASSSSKNSFGSSEGGETRGTGFGPGWKDGSGVSDKGWKDGGNSYSGGWKDGGSGGDSDGGYGDA